MKFIFKINFSSLPIFFYIIATLTAKYVLTILGVEIDNVAVTAMHASVLAIIIFYYIPRNINFNSRIIFNKFSASDNIILLRTARLFMLLGLMSVIINFLWIFSFPLIGGNEIREEFTNNILWNIYIFMSVGVFIEGYRLSEFKKDKINAALLLLYVIAAILTGWKAAVLNLLMMYVITRYPNLKIGIGEILRYSLIITTIFLMINYLRAGGGDIGFVELFYYIYWGYANFSDIALNLNSDCLHSNPFNDCRFSYDNSLLLNSTWNVYTALTPIYIDGGVLYIFLYFGLISISLLLGQHIKGSLSARYSTYLFTYFIFIAHNGFLFNSKSGLFALIFLCIFDIFMKIKNNLNRSLIKI